MSHGRNGKEYNKCGPTFKLMPKLKVTARTKPKFTLEISISSLISYLNVKLYFKYSLSLN